MQKFELTIVCPGDSTPAKIKQIKKSLSDLVKTSEGKIKKEDDWGVIELAYKIKDLETGVFLHYLLELEGKKVGGVNDNLKANEEILRFLIVAKEEKK